MKRPLFNLATAVSLVLCVAMAVLWVRSYWRYEGFWREGGVTSRSFISFGGRLMYTMHYGFERGPLSWKYHVSDFPRMTRFQPLEPPQTWWENLGFYYSSAPGPTAVPGFAGHGDSLTVPHWSAVFVFVVLPILWAIGWWRRRAARSARGFTVNAKTT